MADLLELAEKAWNGELDTMFEHHPVHRLYDGACELAPDLLGMKGLAGMFVIDSGDGLVMLDAGSWFDVDRPYEEIRRWRHCTFSSDGTCSFQAVDPAPNRPTCRGFGTNILHRHGAANTRSTSIRR